MKRARIRSWLATLVAGTLALLVLPVPITGGLGPAHALESKTYQEYVAAVTSLAQGLQNSTSWGVNCDVVSGDDTVLVRGFRSVADASLRYAVNYPNVPLAFDTFGYRSATRWMTPLDDSSPYGFRAPLRPKILALAKAPSNAGYVWGPYAPWVDRYSDVDTSDGLAEMRDTVYQLSGQVALNPVSDSPGLTINFAPQGGLAGSWFLTKVEGSTVNFSTLIVDANGLLASSRHWTMVSGVETQNTECAVNYLATIADYTPDPAVTVPLKTIGPAAWRVSNSVIAVQVGKAIRKGVKASGEITPSRIRGQAYIELTKRGLETTWKVTDLAKGAKISLSDPLGGTVARCITVKKGTLLSKRC